MAVEPTDVFGRILERVERSELETQCRAVVKRDMNAVGRRIKQAAVVLARIREIESAAGQLQHDQQKPSLRVSKANCEHVTAIQDLQQQISTTLECIVKLEGLPEPAVRWNALAMLKMQTTLLSLIMLMLYQQKLYTSDKLVKPHKESNIDTDQPNHNSTVTETKSPSSKGSAKKRQRSGSSESAQSPALSLSYEKQLSKLCHVQQLATPKSVSVWPTSSPNNIIDMIGDGSDESPIEIELIDSDSGPESPTCYDSAVQLQQASTSVQLTQFPLLMRRFASYLDSLADAKLQIVDQTFVSAVEIAIDVGLSLPLSDSTRAAPQDLLAVFQRLKNSSALLSGSLTR